MSTDRQSHLERLDRCELGPVHPPLPDIRAAAARTCARASAACHGDDTAAEADLAVLLAMLGLDVPMPEAAAVPDSRAGRARARYRLRTDHRGRSA